MLPLLHRDTLRAFTLASALLAVQGCAGGASDTGTTDEGALANGDGPTPAPLRRELRVLQRDAATNAWLAREPSRVDGRPIGVESPRVSEVYVRLLEALKENDARPAVLGLALAFNADGASAPFRQKLAELFVDFPSPVALQVTKSTDPQLRGARVAVGHDIISRSCELTADGTCAEGRYFIPLDDPSGAYAEKQPFAAALVAATDAAARHATSGADGIAAAMTKLERYARPFETRTDDGTGAGTYVPDEKRIGIPFEKRTVTRYGIHEVLTSARVRDDLRGRVVVVIGAPGDRTVSFYGGAEAAEEISVPPAAQLAPLIAEP